VEQLGIAASSRYLGQAAVVLACGDDAASIAAACDALRERTGAPVITVATKADLVPKGQEIAADARVSAHTGAGLAELLARIEQRLWQRHGEPVTDAPGLTRARHLAAVTTAAEELRAFAGAWRDDVLPATVAAVHVHTAADALGELIGSVQVDDVLDVVFRRFCVGK